VVGLANTIWLLGGTSHLVLCDENNRQPSQRAPSIQAASTSVLTKPEFESHEIRIRIRITITESDSGTHARRRACSSIAYSNISPLPGLGLNIQDCRVTSSASQLLMAAD